MELVIWLVVVATIVGGAITYARPLTRRREPGSFAWWQRQRRRDHGWWH